MDIICLDLEGVLVPEIWIAFAEITGIEGLKATTRDIPDYDELMTQRLQYLDQHKLGLADIQAVIDQMSLMDGAKDFLDRLREQFQVVILSDTFYEFAQPLMRQLGWPMLLCHRLEIDDRGAVSGYRLRQKDPKRKSVQAFRQLNYRIFAAGDSYNDVGMLAEADAGFLFKPPENVIAEFPQYPVAMNYRDLQDYFERAKADNP
ncbi:MAG: bifunctional phosphoserine phosphatase/homoserine phosphotransferase ThrH [Gammaproteobacteria bacterium]|nr:bifunctional phosphoserine phosphatase/homoserine phosphotransferase ThrH [Gammaproteobacteria bacterium]